MTPAFTTSASAERPFAALQWQAQRAPQAEALRSRRRGQWHAWSWQRLAAQADLAARGWAGLGVLPGDRIVALGPLGAELIVTLFAADALGATVVVAHDAVEAQVVSVARFAFADGTHELERLLRHRGPALRAAVVADAAVVPASGQADGLPLLSLTQLWATGQGHEVLRPDSVRFPIAQGVGPDGTERALGPFDSAGLALRLADRVFADFAPTWLAGLRFVLHAWPQSAPLLLIPEPHGDAVADQRDARANLWLAPAERLTAVAAALNARVPAQGFGARVARAALEGRGSLLGGLARRRIRAGMGLAATRRTASDAVVPEETERLLSALGITPAPRAMAAPPAVTRTPASGLNPPEQAFDRTLVAAP